MTMPFIGCGIVQGKSLWALALPASPTVLLPFFNLFGDSSFNIGQQEQRTALVPQFTLEKGDVCFTSGERAMTCS